MTGTRDLSLAPGCYGAALVYSEESNECKDCPYRVACGPASAARLARLQEELGMTEVVGTARKRKAATAKPEVEGAGLIPTLPKKVQALVDAIDKKGLKVGEKMRAGDNPFDKPVFLKVTAHLLLKLPGGIDRNTLRAALQHKLGWSADTAAAHAGQAFHLFPALGVASERNGKLIFNKD